jgi:hypothetical protein
VNKGLVAAWETLRKAKTGERLRLTLDMAQSNKSTQICLWLRPAASEKERKEQLLAMWMELCWAFEEYQGGGIQGSWLANQAYGLLTGEIDKQPSSFSTEDLVSDLVSFYAAVEGKDPMALVNKYAGRFDAKDEEEVSEAIWHLSLPCQPGYRSWSPSYFDDTNFVAADFSLDAFFAGKYPGLNAEYAFTAQRVQATVRAYQGKFGRPAFPAYFQQYDWSRSGFQDWVIENK